MKISRTIWQYFASRGLTTLVSFLTIAYSARIIGSADIGRYFLFQAVVGVLGLAADLGFKAATQKRISEGGNTGSIITSALSVKAVLSVFTITGVVAVSGWIDSYVGSPIASLVILGVIVQEAFGLTENVLSGGLRVSETARLLAVKQLLWAAFGVAFITAGLDFRGLVYATLLSKSIVTLLIVLRVDVTLEPPSLATVRSLWGYAPFASVGSIGRNVFEWVDVFLIGLFLGQTQVGAYEVAWRLTKVTLLLSIAVKATIFPQVSSWAASGNIEAIEDVLPDMLLFAVVLVTPAFLGVVLFSRQLLSLIFGPEFQIAWLAMIVLIVQRLCQAVDTVVDQIIKGMDYPRFSSLSMAIAIVVNVVSNVILVWQFGLVGAALATFFAYFVLSGLRWVYLNQMLTITVPWRRVGGVVLASLGMAVVTVGVSRVITPDTLGRLLFVIGIGVVSYLAFVLTVPSLRQWACEQAGSIQ